MSSENESVHSPRRRDVLQNIAGASVGLATLGASSGTAAAGGKGGDCDPSADPARIDTSDHFDTTWYGSVYRTEGNTKQNYDREGGEIKVESELLVHLHGWRNDEDCGIAGIAATGSAYEDVGYDQPVTGLTWDSAYAWWNAKEIAKRNAPKLATFLTDFHDANPDTTVRLQAHSVGSLLLAETLLELDSAGNDDIVETAVFMAGAIDNQSVATDGKYGDAIANVTTHTENFWMEDDTVLNWAYQTYETSGAIGNDGCEGTPPDNYTDHEVTKDIGHSDYYDDRDIIRQVNETFA